MWLGTVIPSKHQVKDEVVSLVAGNFFNFFLGAVRALGQEKSAHGCICVVKRSLGAIRKKKALVCGKCGILFVACCLPSSTRLRCDSYTKREDVRFNGSSTGLKCDNYTIREHVRINGSSTRTFSDNYTMRENVNFRGRSTELKGGKP